MGRSMLLVLATSLIAAPPVAVATSEPVAAELARCAAIAASQARLACYDALAGRPPTDRPPIFERATVETAAAPMPRAPQSPPVSAPAESAQNFGLSTGQLHSAPQELQAIQAHIAEVHMDQLRRSSVVLDNGQIWALAEGEMLLDAGEAVTIRRAALGSFMLTSASKHAYPVRRVR